MTPYDLQSRGSPVLADADVWQLPSQPSSDATWTVKPIPIVLHMPFVGGTVIIELQDSEPRWLSDTLNRLSELSTLQADWDSYGGQPISIRAIAAGLNLLGSILAINAPTPSVVPKSNGGVQFEWHCSGIDFEVAIEPDETVSASFENVALGDEWDREPVTDIDELRHVALLL